eukprot:2506432-Rhodomonas_salina.1
MGSYVLTQPRAVQAEGPLTTPGMCQRATSKAQRRASTRRGCMLDPERCRRLARRSGDVPDGQHPKSSAEQAPCGGAHSTPSSAGGGPVAQGMCQWGNIQSAAQSTRPAG